MLAGVGFGEHVGDALTHKLLDEDTKEILYRSSVRPSDSAHPNKCLVSDGEESSQTPKPIVTEVDNLQGVPPTGGEVETMVTP